VVRATIDATSFSTGNVIRDTVVRSRMYLRTARHPHIFFRSRGADMMDGIWVLDGELTVTGIVRPVRLLIGSACVDPAGIRVSAKTVVDRYAFGVTAAKGMTGRLLDMTIEIAATAQHRSGSQ